MVELTMADLARVIRAVVRGLLIEYDNTQDRANHIHSVWRDLRRDFAEDLLAQHYAGVRH